MDRNNIIMMKNKDNKKKTMSKRDKDLSGNLKSLLSPITLQKGTVKSYLKPRFLSPWSFNL